MSTAFLKKLKKSLQALQTLAFINRKNHDAREKTGEQLDDVKDQTGTRTAVQPDIIGTLQQIQDDTAGEVQEEKGRGGSERGKMVKNGNMEKTGNYSVRVGENKKRHGKK